MAKTAPITLVLTLQVTLSARFLSSSTAFTDEGLYLWSGRLEWDHWLHGRTIPPFPTYFSGAPVLYPVLASITSIVGGLAGARLLSLAFMLGATWLLYATTHRLFNRRSGFFASLVWVLLAPTIAVGTLATFDAMSMFFLAGAVWSVARSRMRYDFTGWTVVAGLCLVLANTSAYSSAIFDPVVVCIAVLIGWPAPTPRVVAMRVSALACYITTGLIIFVVAGGGYYSTGIIRTVVDRAAGDTPARQVLAQSWTWVALVGVLAVVGVLVSVLVDRSGTNRLLLVVLSSALLVVPIEQARIHTTTSLYKHLDMGAWLAAISAGYALSALLGLTRRSKVSGLGAVLVVASASLVVPSVVSQVRVLTDWPNVNVFVTALRPLIARTNGPLLVETPSPARYYLSNEVAWQRWSDTRNIILANGKSTGSSTDVTGAGNLAAFKPLIANGYFTLVALNLTATPALDHDLVAAIALNKQYRFVEKVPYGYGFYSIWRLTSTVSGSAAKVERAPHRTAETLQAPSPTPTATPRASPRRTSPTPLLPSASANTLGGN